METGISSASPLATTKEPSSSSSGVKDSTMSANLNSLPTLNHCFLCLSEIKKTIKHPPSPDVKLSLQEEVSRIKTLIDKKNRYHVAIKYLIHSCTDDREKIHNQSKLINKLLTVLKVEINKETGFNVQESLCLPCERKFKEIVKLHHKLELIQIKLGEAIKTLHEVVLGSSVYGSNDQAKTKMRELEVWLQNEENNCESVFVKTKKEWMETLVEFQTVIFQRSEEKNEVSCSYLKKCDLTPTAISAFQPSRALSNPNNQKLDQADQVVSATNSDANCLDNDAQLPQTLDYVSLMGTPDFDLSTLVKTEFLEKSQDDIDTQSDASLNLDFSHLTQELSGLDVINASNLLESLQASISTFKAPEVGDSSLTKLQQVRRGKGRRLLRTTRRSKENNFQAAEKTIPPPKLRKLRSTVKSLKSKIKFASNRKSTSDSADVEGKNEETPLKSKKVQRKRKARTPKPMPPRAVTRMAIVLNKERRLRTYKCDTCSYSSPSMYTFIQHLRTHEAKEKTFMCQEEECEDRHFSGAQFFKLHQLQHKEGQYQWKCKVCSKRISPQEYTKHLKTHGGTPVYPCEYCYYGSTTVVDFVYHLRYHRGTPKCIFCQAVIPKVAGVSTYAQHLHKEHGCNEVLVPCDFEGCKEIFYCSYSMQTHKNVHSKKFHCDKCARSFATSSAQRIHIQERHTKEKVHSCTIPDCGEAFITHPELERHLVDKHDRPKYKCSQCPDRQYSNLRSLRVHERRQHQNSIYSCDICGKSFKNLAYLNKHKLIHGPRNIICEICGFATNSPYQLQKHKVIHKDVPLHGCPHCPKRFNYKRALEDHIRTHTGQRPFVCHYCSAAFAQKGACMNHIRRLHEKDNKPRKRNTIIVEQSTDNPPTTMSSTTSSQTNLTSQQTSQLEVQTLPTPSVEMTYDLINNPKLDNLSGSLPLQNFDQGSFS